MSTDTLVALKALLAEKLSLPDYREVEAHLAGVVVLPADHPLRTGEPSERFAAIFRALAGPDEAPAIVYAAAKAALVVLREAP